MFLGYHNMFVIIILDFLLLLLLRGRFCIITTGFLWWNSTLPLCLFLSNITLYLCIKQISALTLICPTGMMDCSDAVDRQEDSLGSSLVWLHTRQLEVEKYRLKIFQTEVPGCVWRDETAGGLRHAGAGVGRGAGQAGPGSCRPVQVQVIILYFGNIFSCE